MNSIDEIFILLKNHFSNLSDSISLTKAKTSILISLVGNGKINIARIFEISTRQDEADVLPFSVKLKLPNEKVIEVYKEIIEGDFKTIKPPYPDTYYTTVKSNVIKIQNIYSRENIDKILPLFIFSMERSTKRRNRNRNKMENGMDEQE